MLEGDALRATLRRLWACQRSAPHFATQAAAYRRCDLCALRRRDGGPVRAILHSKRLTRPERAHCWRWSGSCACTCRTARSRRTWRARRWRDPPGGHPLRPGRPRPGRETLPDDGPGLWHHYNTDYMLHGHGPMFAPHLGRRVYDVLATIRLLAGEGAEEVELIGRGQGALLALFAALGRERHAVTLANAGRHTRSGRRRRSSSGPRRTCSRERWST